VIAITLLSRDGLRLPRAGASGSLPAWHHRLWQPKSVLGTFQTWPTRLTMSVRAGKRTSQSRTQTS